MQALVKKGKGQGNLGIEEVAVPPLGNEDVLIRVKAAAIYLMSLAERPGTRAMTIAPATGRKIISDR